jgi:ATP-dependent Lon protease
MSERITLPVIPLRGSVLFAGVATPVTIGREASLRAAEAALTGDGRVFAVAQRDSNTRPELSNLYTMGVIAKISPVQRADGKLHVVLEGEKRASALEYRPGDDYLKAVVLPVREVPPPDAEDTSFIALHDELREKAAELAKKRGVPEQVMAKVLKGVTDPGALADLVAAHLEVPTEEKQALLETTVVEDRLRKVLVQVQRTLQQLDARESIQSQVREELGERQRELFLREQMKAIQRELGESDDGEESLKELRERLEALPLPDEARAEVRREWKRLERMGRESAESQVIRTYLELIAELPWGTRSEDVLDVQAAEKILDGDHYGLAEVKDRVLEYLAVRQLQQRRDQAKPDARPDAPADVANDNAAEAKKAKAQTKGPILLFIGPPGVGKTSIGKSIARALGRKYARISLGGVRDEADIRGHRRTYVGAMPGRIVQALKQAGTRNPVILLDEVDKLGVSYQGNPASALLEVLDPAQNHAFTDHYLGVPFDLSEVLFVATANFIEGIPAPLLDRMEVVEFAGYTEREKREIAKKYLIPRQLKESGLEGESFALNEQALADIVSRYTREAGVRQLERRISQLTRKLARKVASGETLPSELTPELVRSILGRPRVRPEKAGEHNEVGVATGMYYTPAGGDIMFVESSIRKLQDFRHADTSLQVQGWGNVSLILTGQLGDVMKESARAALTYAATHALKLGIADERLGSIEAHVHVPAGAVPKDGPSAGAAMATSLVSAMTGRPVRRDLAMTGEITLRGRVLPIGGVKEKVLGAHRAGIEHIVLPIDNEADLDDLPEEVRSSLKISLVRSLDEVFELALLDAPRKPERAAPAAAAH